MSKVTVEKSLSVTEAIERLRLFNEKAAKLSRLSFADKAFAENAGATLHYDSELKRARLEKRGADEESTDALALTLRLFLQPRDGIQFEQIERLYQQMALPEEDKYWVTENLKDLNAFLASAGTPEIRVDGERITHRIVLETFLYGNLAHANEDKRKRLVIWKSLPVGLLLESTFEYIVGEVMRFIFWLARMNVEAIQVLEHSRNARQTSDGGGTDAVSA